MFIGLYVTRSKSSAAVSRLILPVHRFNVTINKQQTVTRLYLVTSIWSCPRAECTFCFITSIVFVLFPGVFNSAEAWRQCHIGHDVEGKTAASMWDWHKHHHLQLHQQIVLIWRNKCILPRWLIYSLFHVFLFVCVTLVFQLHKQADMQEEKNRIERVLGAISAPDLIQKVLNFALSVHVYCTWSNVDVVPARDLSL